MEKVFVNLISCIFNQIHCKLLANKLSLFSYILIKFSGQFFCTFISQSVQVFQNKDRILFIGEIIIFM